MFKNLPFLITILGIVLGVFIAILFGVNEDIFKNKIKEGLAKNVAIEQILDPELKAKKIEAEKSKNWRYYQRFHFHATGIGAMSMGLLLLLSFLRAPETPKKVAAYLISIGGFLYPFIWLFAGMYGPEMGRSEAKEAFAIFGYMGGLFLLGAVIELILVARYPLKLEAQ